MVDADMKAMMAEAKSASPRQTMCHPAEIGVGVSYSDKHGVPVDDKKRVVEMSVSKR